MRKSLFVFEPKTFYVSRDVSLFLFKTEFDAEVWWHYRYTGGPIPVRSAEIEPNELFYVTQVINNNIDGQRRGLIQVIYKEVIGFFVYSHLWTGIKKYYPEI